MNDTHSEFERVELQGFLAWFDAAAAARIDDLPWQCRQIGDASCFLCPNEPSILVNRVLGLGSSELPSLDQLVAIRELYADAGLKRFFLHVMPERFGPDPGQLLAAAGYTRYRGWMKFSRDTVTPMPARSELSVRRIGRDHAADFAAIAGAAFDFQPAFQPAIAALADAAGWQLYMSFDGTTPAGTGGLFVRGGIGTLDFGSTDPGYRRRGGQSAVLRARIDAARDAGCHAIVTMTGEAVAGEEQHSYRNIERAGFAPAYVRENWIPSAT